MKQGESPTVIARTFGVCRTSLYRWRAMVRSSREGLAAKPHPGPKLRLTAEQLRELERLLLQGAVKLRPTRCANVGA
jgi:transposase-like protein